MIFNFFFQNFVILKNNFQIFFKKLRGLPCHVAKVAQSATSTWPKPCQISRKVGSRTFFK